MDFNCQLILWFFVCRLYFKARRRISQYTRLQHSYLGQIDMSTPRPLGWANPKLRQRNMYDCKFELEERHFLITYQLVTNTLPDSIWHNIFWLLSKVCYQNSQNLVRPYHPFQMQKSFWNFAQIIISNQLCSWRMSHGKQNFTRFGFKMNFGQISYIALPNKWTSNIWYNNTCLLNGSFVPGAYISNALQTFAVLGHKDMQSFNGLCAG